MCFHVGVWKLEVVRVFLFMMFMIVLCCLFLQENINRTLSEKVPYLVDQHHLDDPHVKANLLFQVSGIFICFLMKHGCTYLDPTLRILLSFWEAYHLYIFYDATHMHLFRSCCGDFALISGCFSFFPLLILLNFPIAGTLLGH